MPLSGVEIARGNQAQWMGSGENKQLRLVMKRPGFEVMRQSIDATAVVWVAPAEDPNLQEFFYVLSGSLSLRVDGREEILHQGDCFCVSGINADLPLRMLSDTELLYICDMPVFEGLDRFHAEMDDLVRTIDAKDHYTLQHSRNVMRYCVDLYSLFPESERQISMDDLVVASMFHDVGKCAIPDAVLLKNGRYLPEEYEIMKRHPIESANYLRPRFGERIAEIVLRHHERLDGSGYPDGLRGDALRIETNIIAVADSFDAMTSQRSYNRRKEDLEAALELYDLPQRYDRRVTELLLRLVRENKLPRPMPDAT